MATFTNGNIDLAHEEIARDGHEKNEQDLIDELLRRGWKFKEVRIPVQISGPKGGPTRLVRQLQHSSEIEG